jgi:four helix bundle protein
VCRARSKAEFIAKIGVVEEEVGETVFWLEMLVEAGIVAQSRMESLRKEAAEPLAKFAASQHTARNRRSWQLSNEPMNQFYVYTC